MIEPSDELSLKEIILKGQEYFKEVLRNWKLISLVSAFFVCYMLYKAFVAKPTYRGTLTFMVNEDEGGGGGGVGAILGSIGLGGALGGGEFNLDKVLALGKSRRIIQEVLFEKRTINGKEDYLANHLMQVYNLQEKWGENSPELIDFVFKSGNLEDFDLKGRRVFNILYIQIVGSKRSVGLLTSQYSKESGIMSISANSQSQDLSIALTEVTYDKLSTFYTTKTVEKQQKTFDLISTKVDSVKNLLNSKELALVNFIDSSKGFYTMKAKLREAQLTRDVKLLNEVYAKALENLEVADFSLKSKTPFVQLIDAPFAPLRSNSPSKLMAVILGILLGSFLSIGFIIVRKIYREVMDEEN